MQHRLRITSAADFAAKVEKVKVLLDNPGEILLQCKRELFSPIFTLPILIFFPFNINALLYCCSNAFTELND